jgi:hypothetical protein
MLARKYGVPAPIGEIECGDEDAGDIFTDESS